MTGNAGAFAGRAMSQRTGAMSNKMSNGQIGDATLKYDTFPEGSEEEFLSTRKPQRACSNARLSGLEPDVKWPVGKKFGTEKCQ